MMSVSLARPSQAQACLWIKHNRTIVAGQGPLNGRGGRLARTDVDIEAASHLRLGQARPRADHARPIDGHDSEIRQQTSVRSPGVRMMHGRYRLSHDVYF